MGQSSRGAACVVCEAGWTCGQTSSVLLAWNRQQLRGNHVLLRLGSSAILIVEIIVEQMLSPSVALRQAIPLSGAKAASLQANGTWLTKKLRV